MNAVLTSTPPRTQAAILRSVIAEKHPKFALGDIAHHYGLTMTDLQTLLRRYSYPDKVLMTRAAAELDLEAQELAAAHADDEPTSDAGDVGAILINVRVADLQSDPDNPREHLDDIEDLADSIRSIGLLQPPVVRRAGNRLVIVAGHRRVAAIRHLKWTDVDVIVRNQMRPDHVLAAMLIENGQRRDLDPIEEARAMAKLQNDYGLTTHAAIGELIGRNQMYVSNRLALLGLSAAEQAQVRNGEMKLAEAHHRGRMNTGKIRQAGVDRNWHLNHSHDLANQVKARCVRLGHSRGRTVGGIGCGECWETVIRADERAVLIRAANEDGICPTCGTQQ
jgi:ParB family chromosome partitioning protein